MNRWVWLVLIVLVAAVAAVLLMRESNLPSSTPSTGTAPASVTQPESTTSQVKTDISSMSLKDKIADLLILHVPGTDPATLAAYVRQYHPAGLILMADNIPATKTALRSETEAIQQTTNTPYFISTDEEGCTVKRLASDTFACPTELGTEPVSNTTSAFSDRSSLLQSVGINLNFGIIADITSDPKSFIYPRVFSGDPQVAGARVSAAVAASKGKTLSTLKHFPGHGETEENSHTTIPVTGISKDQWSSTDAVPFKDGIDAGADVLMFGQLTYSSVDTSPASLSKTWHDIAASELGFKGLMITDDMFMLQQSGDPAYADPVANAVAALKAGNDLLLYVNNHGQSTTLDVPALIDGIAAAVQSGQLSESDINAKLQKVLAARMSLPSY